MKVCFDQFLVIRKTPSGCSKSKSKTCDNNNIINNLKNNKLKIRLQKKSTLTNSKILEL